ncbi:ammosamide/lymphostin RiPP family protein [Kitasatospora sp. NPDC088160]|uniref:ammosamide/lymphostin RiPP family protein n=1 Tax=Kitasatospora sp. NPDC088160 TaxID=3364072 RepID=UPI003809E0C3
MEDTAKSTAKSTEPEETAEALALEAEAPEAQAPEVETAGTETPQAETPQAETAGTESAEDTELDALDELDDVDFDLDEVENKIAPLALATTEPSRW